MKRIHFLLLCAMWIGNGYAQDLIVTTAGDSILCKITRERDGFVYFTYNKDGAPTSTLVAKDSIANMHRDMYKIRVRNAGEQGYASWQYRLHGGYSRRLAPVSDQVLPGMTSYLNKMKSGYTVGGDVHYYISEPLGFGVKYVHNAYQYKETGFEDKVRMNYFALSMLNRTLLRSANEVFLGLNLGYQTYSDNLGAIGTDIRIDGGTVGLGLEAGYAVKLGKVTKAFLGISVLNSTITKINVETGGMRETIKLEKEEFEGLGRLEVTLGLIFGK